MNLVAISIVADLDWNRAFLHVSIIVAEAATTINPGHWFSALIALPPFTDKWEVVVGLSACLQWSCFTPRLSTSHPCRHATIPPFPSDPLSGAERYVHGGRVDMAKYSTFLRQGTRHFERL